ncbi:MAG: hypothetical protein WA797_02325 [Acidimicrobiales bacterium]
MNPSVPEDLHEWLSFEDVAEARTWMFDVTFLLSRWTCIFGNGCQGILEEPAPERVDGCCSHGAHYVDDDDRERVERLAAQLGPDEWQFASLGHRKGISVREKDGAWRTRVHDGACVLLNRPGFAAGPGCALHQVALNRGRSHIDFKPNVCWQLPLRLVDSTDENGHVTSTLREWKRRDWGTGGDVFHWWCTEAGEAFSGSATVLVSMRDEIVALVGSRPYDQLVEALADRLSTSTPLPHPSLRVRDR